MEGKLQLFRHLLSTHECTVRGGSMVVRSWSHVSSAFCSSGNGPGATKTALTPPVGCALGIATVSAYGYHLFKSVSWPFENKNKYKWNLQINGHQASCVLLQGCPTPGVPQFANSQMWDGSFGIYVEKQPGRGVTLLQHQIVDSVFPLKPIPFSAEKMQCIP